MFWYTFSTKSLSTAVTESARVAASPRTCLRICCAVEQGHTLSLRFRLVRTGTGLYHVEHVKGRVDAA